MGFLLLISLLPLIVSAQDEPSCFSKIFCQGDLLDTVQSAELYPDSKTFVDMKLKNNEATTLENFDKLRTDTNNNPTKDQIKQFVSDNFETYQEFEDWVPADFNASPAFLSSITDKEVKTFAQNLVNIWPKLARKIRQEVFDSPDLFTILPVTHGFIVPGGRFREFYYWDSYWIIKGLLLSEMTETVRGMLDNFLSIVEKYGFLPNGARIYYLNRSQPPLLSMMVADYIAATNDTKWLQDNIKTLDSELQFWLDKKVTDVVKNGVKHTLAHYASQSGSPRPESYIEDVRTASGFSGAEKKRLYADLKSGAESGWDFSTRWIVDANGGINANLSSLQTSRIIPVDLNSFLCAAFRKLGEFYVILGDYSKATYWFEREQVWRNSIDAVFYNEDDKIWYDWDSELGQHRKYFFPSNFAPLWAEAYDPARAESLGLGAAEYYVRQNISDYQGGIPATLTRSGEQWDYPNAWPPLQSIVAGGLDKSGNCKAKEIAKEIAQRYVAATMIGYNDKGDMYEKYDAETPGAYGGGGEYDTQNGFGWTNGIALEFIARYYLVPEKRA